MLGELYEQMQDLVAAHTWFNLAGQTQERDRIAKLMKPAEIAQAQRMATEWAEAHK